MTDYFYGSEVGSFTPSQSEDVGDTTGTNVLDRNETFARAAVYTNGALAFLESSAISIPNTFWFHYDAAKRFTTASYNYPIVFSAGGVELLRIGYKASACKVQAYIGAVWTDIGTEVSADFGADSNQTMDFYFEGNDATGAVKIFVAGTERMSAVGDLSAVTGLDLITVDGVTSGGAHGGSQFIISDEITIGWRLMTATLSGAGATSAWTGDYTSVDEATYNDADFIYSGTANQVETYTISTGTLTGYTVRGVGVYARAKRGDSGPQNFQLALRVGSTDYFSGTKALGVGYESYGHIWNTNPDTAAEWSTSQVSSIQVGVKSIT